MWFPLKLFLDNESLSPDTQINVQNNLVLEHVCNFRWPVILGDNVECVKPPTNSNSFYLVSSDFHCRVINEEIPFWASLLLLTPHLFDDFSFPQNLLRVFTVFMTGCIVLVIPNFANLMALVGATCCTMLAFTLPGLFHMCIFKG